MTAALAERWPTPPAWPAHPDVSLNLVVRVVAGTKEGRLVKRLVLSGVWITWTARLLHLSAFLLSLNLTIISRVQRSSPLSIAGRRLVSRQQPLMFLSCNLGATRLLMSLERPAKGSEREASSPSPRRPRFLTKPGHPRPSLDGGGGFSITLKPRSGT